MGGVETHLWDYSRLLAARDIDVTVFTGTPEAAIPRHAGISVLYHSDLDLSAHRRRPPGEPSLRTWFSKELSPDPARGRAGIRLVHGHNLHHFSDRPARALNSLRKELDLRLVHTYHSVWHERPANPAARACRGWHRHYAVSDFLRRACAREIDVDPERRYLGVDTNTYQDVPVSGGRQRPGRVLLPARLIPNKGALLAVEAVHHIIRNHMTSVRPHLVLTETKNTVDFHHEKDGFREELQQLIVKLEIEDHVEFVEAQVDEMRDLYEEASVVIYPSVFDEPMGLAPLEAMCAARPVVVTRMGGLDEGIEYDGEMGYLVPDRNVHKLADRIALLLDSPGLAQTVGRRAREHVMEHFDLEKHYVRPMIGEYLDQLGAGPGDSGGSTVLL
ncbi:glycosyltransferase family 4 protein [Streptomyces sp. NPDC051243]|uniref:glycosyltransferase family 4 protein n=1 Tax=Streptomyces sp. NPDC051243 TaxID=3365646 RepID=UPI0037BC98E7